MSLTVTLPWPPRILWPNGRGHWAKRAAAVKRARREGHVLAQAAGARVGMFMGADRVSVALSFRLPPMSRPDDDGMIAAVKSYRDGIADACGVDDRRFRLVAPVIGPRQPGGAVIVTLTPETAA